MIFLSMQTLKLMLNWWKQSIDSDKIGISGLVKIFSIDGNELHNFKSDFGQELLLNFVVN